MSAAPAGAATTSATGVEHTSASDTVLRAGSEPQLVAQFREAAAKQAAVKPASKSRTYKVKAGDSLSKIAQHFYSESAAWPVLYYANRHSIKSANEISVGQKLTIPAKPAKIPAAPAAPVVAPVSQVSTSAAPAQVTSTAQPVSTSQPSSTYSGSGSFQSCVISRESGGNSQVMNGSGHYGLYQFSEGTWEAYGGSASSFGNASVAQQNAVFNNAISQGGQSNWSAYDGC
ncbi:MAG TPA: transglycosylase family protein [Streptosporangiaceae bacterium]|jgi:LysM repeat protein